MFLSISYSHAQVSKTITIATPGSLETALGSEKNTITDLTVSGNLNASDFNTIRGMSKLAKLDISKSDVESNKIPDNAFVNISLNRIILPSTITVIGRGAFAQSNIKSMKIPEAVTRFDDKAFEFANITGIDFSSCKNITYIGSIAFNELKTDLDMTPFTALETIGVHCFVNSNITKTFIPRTVKNIDRGAFRNCSQLAEITSTNPTPPQLGSSVFDGVNKQTCVLLVPKGSVELYASTSQWQDFLHIREIESDPINPNLDKVQLEFEMIYKRTTGQQQQPDGSWIILGDTAIVNYPYEGVRIGEYYWMTSNLSHPIQYKNWDQYQGGAVLKDITITQEMIDKVMDAYALDKSDYYRIKNDEDFVKYFGRYYQRDAVEYLIGMKTSEKVNDKWVESKDADDTHRWKVPYMEDFRQLSASIPLAESCGILKLNTIQIQHHLGAEKGSNPFAIFIPDNDQNDGYNYNFNWFTTGGSNYGFNLMPSGQAAQPGIHEWANGRLDENNKPMIFIADKEGDFIQLFQTVYYPTDGGNTFRYAEAITSYREDAAKSFKRLPIRLARRLTDEELGYKLYIQTNKGSIRNSQAWKDLTTANWNAGNCGFRMPYRCTPITTTSQRCIFNQRF